MKAIRVHTPGGLEALVYEENVLIPEIQANHVLIENKAIGVNFIDVYHRTGLYKTTLPCVIGRDGAGIVKAVGEGVTDIKVGQRVAYGPDGSGSYAEYTLVPAIHVAVLPESISFEEGTCAMVQALTAHYLVKGSYYVKKGDSVLVHAAAGGLGKLVCQMAKHLGAFVIGTTSSEEKAAIAKASGCDEVILYTKQNFEVETRRITNNKGVNVVYDGVGKDTFEKSLNCLARRGFMVSCGNASGPVLPSTLSAKGSLTLNRPSLGDYIATREEFLERVNEVFDWATKGIIKLEVAARFPLKEAAEAHKALEGNCKVVGK